MVALFSLPLLASAGTAPSEWPDVWSPASIHGPFVTCTGTGNQATTLPNSDQIPAMPQCQDLCDLIYTIVSDVYICIAFVIWIILPIMFVVGGIMYMMGGANPKLLTSAKSTLMGAVIGTIIVLCAYLLISTFVGFMQINGIGGFSNGASICKIPTSTGS